MTIRAVNKDTSFLSTCGFVEFCEKDEDNYSEIKRLVFSGHGVSSACEG